MKLLSFVTAALILVGCATPAELRSRTPVFAQKSNRPPAPVAGCIVDQIEAATRWAGISTRPTATGFSIRKDGFATGMGMDTAFIIDVTQEDRGSQVRYFSNLALRSDDGRVVEFIRRCIG